MIFQTFANYLSLTLPKYSIQGSKMDIKGTMATALWLLGSVGIHTSKIRSRLVRLFEIGCWKVLQAYSNSKVSGLGPLLRLFIKYQYIYICTAGSSMGTPSSYSTKASSYIAGGIISKGIGSPGIGSGTS